MDQAEAWRHEFDFEDCRPGGNTTAEVDDVALVQPVGFVWFQKPRYRVKAVSVRR